MVQPATLQTLITELNEAQNLPKHASRAALLNVFAEELKTLNLDSGHAVELPGPTGELNLLSEKERGVVLCLGPDRTSARQQAATALSQGNKVIVIASDIADLLAQAAQQNLPLLGTEGSLALNAISSVQGFAAVCYNASTDQQRDLRITLSKREGALLPLITEMDQPERFVIERHLCIDTTAAGGNASLIAASE
jgi:RHH-type proline utilization regulon transcriptional repressor/proline dehydrogenase/delta 1-pyrroline-5-carboxylate dehydrogenase